MTIGVIFLLIIARKVWRGDFDTERRGFFTSRKGSYEIVEITGLYWHFVDLVWVFIFAFSISGEETWHMATQTSGARTRASSIRSGST